MADPITIQGHYGAARLRRYYALSLVNLETQCGQYECEIELTPEQARKLASELVSAADEMEMHNGN